MRKRLPFEELYEIDPVSGCWLWKGGIQSSGYGVFYPPEGGPGILAHRFSWKKHRGEPTACVLHRCDVRRCVNPDDLFLGSKADNSRDMVAKGRSASRSSVTKEQVEEIQRLRIDGETYEAIAKRVGIGMWTVRDVLQRRRGMYAKVMG